MKQNFQKYRNIIKCNEDYIPLENQFPILIEQNIYDKSFEIGKYVFDIYVKEGQYLYAKGTEVFYDFFKYELNSVVYNLISDEIFEYVSRGITSVMENLKEEIKLALGKFKSVDDKIDYLEQKFGEIYDACEQCQNRDVEITYQTFYGLDMEKLSYSRDWFNTLWFATENCHIFRYLSTNDSIYDCFKEYIDQWVEFGKIKSLEIYCDYQIKQIENFSELKQYSSEDFDDDSSSPAQIFYIENIQNKKNRFPFIFLSPYSCELFHYIVSLYINPKPITYHYFFNIFSQEKLFRKNIHKINYLRFLNKSFSLKEERIREELSIKVLDEHIDNFKIFKKDFDVQLLENQKV